MLLLAFLLLFVYLLAPLDEGDPRLVRNLIAVRKLAAVVDIRLVDRVHVQHESARRADFAVPEPANLQKINKKQQTLEFILA